MLLACISAGRPEAVGTLPGWTFYVSPADEDAYRAAGAPVRTAEGLVGARNAALDDAFARGEACAAISDDLLSLVSPFADDDDPLPRRITETFEAMAQALDGTGIFLGGVPTHTNPYWARGGESITTSAWVDGDFQIVRPSAIRYDPEIPLNEPLDFALAHLHEHGQVARFNHVLAKFRHRTNAGGAVATRAAHPELEEECRQRLAAKWSCCVTYTEGKDMPTVRFRQVHQRDHR
jgi:hypothetical protein